MQAQEEKEKVTPSLIQIAGLQRSGTTWMRILLRDNFTLKVRSTHKHYGANDKLPRESGGMFDTFADDLRAERALCVVVRKRFKQWVESVNRKPGILRGHYDGLTVQGVIPETMIPEARKLHDSYYAAWAQHPDIAVTVPYEWALAETLVFLDALQLMYKLSGVRKSAEWNLGKTWTKGPDRERYLGKGN